MRVLYLYHVYYKSFHACTFFRWKECVTVVNEGFDMITAHLYISEYFDDSITSYVGITYSLYLVITHIIYQIILNNPNKYSGI